MKTWDCQNGYMDQFSRDYRGTFGDRFCRAVRDGCEDVPSMLEYVRREASRLGGEWLTLARTLATTEAWDFAQHILDRESLPWEEKLALKAARSVEKTASRKLAHSVDYKNLPF